MPPERPPDPAVPAVPGVRQAVRALLVTPDDRVLLIRTAIPQRPGAHLHLTPGGGVEPGEGAVEALRRELLEETGRDGLEAGPEVWRRTHTYRWAAKIVTQAERYFVVRTPAFAPVPQAGVPDFDDFVAFRWWSAAEVAASDEHFVPYRLAALLPPLLAALRDGRPLAPVDVGP
ncbi:MAG: NUDIX domain-containing protein [Planctomycetia bacterium]|nr:NUDIX domain-containing protein [Planctomycetia bacterium]